jgi:hypothetical protein
MSKGINIFLKERKFFISGIFFLACFLISSSQIIGTEEFSTSSVLTYDLKSDGVMGVTQKISLENKLSDIYATSYSISIGSLKLKNIKSWDKTGALDMEVERTEEQTKIDLRFNDIVVGKGKSQQFWISYEMPDLAKKEGIIWEINLPKIGNLDSFDSLVVQLRVPLSFGNPAYIIPEPQKRETLSDVNTFYFSREQISKSGVISAFGKFQIFGFKLVYHLENIEPGQVKTEIAVPPDTNYQKIVLKKIEPRPVNVRVDEDGNWLAEFYLDPHERKEILVEGKAQVFAEARNIQKRPIDFKSLILAQKYWEVQDPEIQKIAGQVKNANDAYRFVVGLLNYDYNRTDKKIERFGAKKALESPKNSLCMEFTDLLVTLLRAKGIPAREVNGYAHTTNTKLQPLSKERDVLHSWVEYYDSEEDRWIQVDPTWEKTTGGVDFFSKLDMSHLTFVVHGASSEYPITPGSYKIKDEEKKDVEVFFDKLEKEELESNLSLDFSLPGIFFSFVPTSGNLVIKNSGFVADYDVIGNVQAENLEINEPSTVNLDTLPPFSVREVKIELKNNLPFFLGSGIIKVEIQNNKFEHKVNLIPVIYVFLISFIGGSVVWIVIFRITPKARRIFFQRSKR